MNDFYLKMFDLAEDTCRAGGAFADVLRTLARRGEYGRGEVEALIAKRLEPLRRREATRHVWRRPNGQAVSAEGRPLPRGGYVFTFTGIQASELIQTGHKAAIVALADLAEFRDMDLGEHVFRVARLSHDIARTLRRQGKYSTRIDDAFCARIATASILHDVGKVTIPNEILRKPGRLTDEERRAMETHAESGGVILQRAARMAPESGYFDLGAQIAIGHHEWWNGDGYPKGLVGEDIPIAARIVAVADVFDALISERPYKPAWCVKRAVEIIQEARGTQFDPLVIDAFLAVMEERAKAKLIAWTPEMSVGHAELDRDHREIISLLNQLSVPENREDRVTLEVVLDELFAYTLAHFSREEAYMRSVRFPDAERHARLHQRLADRLLELRGRVLAGEDGEVGDQIVRFLGGWLTGHILREDQKCFAFVEQAEGRARH